MPVTKSRPELPMADTKRQRSIHSFSRPTKPGILSERVRSRNEDAKVGAEENQAAEVAIGSSRKRKRSLTDHTLQEPQEKDASRYDSKVEDRNSTFYPRKNDAQSKTPKKRAFTNPQSLPTPEDTPKHSYSPSRAKQNHPLQATPCRPTRSITPTASSNNSSLRLELSTPESQLPDALYDLIDLQAAFLKSLSLHFAHHGVASPVDLPDLMPSVSKTWGRRKVVLEDISRLLGILQESSAENHSSKHNSKQTSEYAKLKLYNHGNSRIWLELDAADRPNARHARPLDEDKLNSIFETNLRRLWTNQGANNINDVSRFISFLPQASTPPHPSAACSVTTHRSQLGQSRLTDVLPPQRKKPAPPPSAAATAPSTPSARLESRQSSLLSRLAAKSAAATTARTQQPGRSASTPAQAARRAALERAADVAATLSLLRGAGSTSEGSVGGAARHTYSMPALVQVVQASSSCALGAEEAQRSIEVLAEEGSVGGDGFVRVVRLGGGRGVVVGVVVDVSRRVPLQEVRRRVVAALEAMDEA